MSLVLKKTGLLCCVFLSVASEHMRWLGGDFHTVNHVYFSAEKVQFALHLFPKQIILFCGLDTWTDPITHNNQEQCRPFSSLVSTVKKYFLILRKLLFSIFYFLFIRPIFTPVHSTTYVYAKLPILCNSHFFVLTHDRYLVKIFEYMHIIIIPISIYQRQNWGEGGPAFFFYGKMEPALNSKM